MRLRIPDGPCPRLGPARQLGAASAACSAALVLTGLAACGSPAGPAGSAATGSADTACAASVLKVTVDATAAGTAAGTTYYPIDFTNASAASCRLDGYPDAWFVTSAGQRIGAAATRDRAITARPVPLAPGATAHAWLQVADAANYPAKACRPVTAHVLLIRAPGAAAASSVRRTFPACAAAMHGHSILTVQPILPGRARRGAA
jgi:hypothetical protein